MLSGKGLLLLESNMLLSVLRLDYMPFDIYFNFQFHLPLISTTNWATGSRHWVIRHHKLKEYPK
jgi:hypothetical protein